MCFGARETGDEKGVQVCLKKINTVRTHLHTNVEQMSSVQCGINEPWMI